MLFKVEEIDGHKKVVPLTADIGAGVPVGFFAPFAKKSSPSGWLYCDGSTFDETLYPALYAYLGTNKLPDLREVGLTGAEKNTTYIFDSTETDPSTGQAGTQSHDVFAGGEFKDDQVQNHRHRWQTGGAGINDGVSQFSVTRTAGWENYTKIANGTGDTGSSVRIGGVLSGRTGDVTRGKSYGVFWYVKATSGLTENAQDNVLSTLNQQRSYSETETDTGKKWIDGKPIYRKVVKIDNPAVDWTTIDLTSSFPNLSEVITVDAIGKRSDGYTVHAYRRTDSDRFDYSLVNKDSSTPPAQEVRCNITSSVALNKIYFTVEYTKSS